MYTPLTGPHWGLIIAVVQVCVYYFGVVCNHAVPWSGFVWRLITGGVPFQLVFPLPLEHNTGVNV